MAKSLAEEKNTETLSDIDELVAKTTLVKSNKDQELTYRDRFMTVEQQKRDTMITKLLDEYLKSYQNKTDKSSFYRSWIFGSCIGIVIAFSVALLKFGCYIFTPENVISTEDVVAFATVCISFVSSIVGLLTIITKYFFPENDEQYITQIVETIQKNDLENKRENAKNVSS